MRDESGSQVPTFAEKALTGVGFLGDAMDNFWVECICSIVMSDMPSNDHLYTDYNDGSILKVSLGGVMGAKIQHYPSWA